VRVSADRDHSDRSIVITEIGIVIADIGVVITGDRLCVAKTLSTRQVVDLSAPVGQNHGS
jgi:hypothetical protein